LKAESARIIIDHQDETVGQMLLMDAIGTADPEFFEGLIVQLAAVADDGPATERGLNFIFSVVEDVRPRNQLEAMLAAQMAVVHLATMEYARQILHIQFEGQLEVVERTLNKLCRTFAAQLDALQRHRMGDARTNRVPENEDPEPSADVRQSHSDKATEHAPHSSKPAAAA
jgi:hypothetical protein